MIRGHMKEDKQNKKAQPLNSFNPGRSLEKGMATHSSIILPRDFHGQRSLVGYSPQGCKELGTTERPYLLTYLLTYLEKCMTP